MDEEKKTLPITTGLRDAVHRYNKYSSMAMPCPAVEYVKLDADTFDRLCDAIDAIHAGLEHDVEMWRDRAEDMRMERDNALQGRHRYPDIRDADHVPIRIGDVMDFKKNVRGLTVLGIGTAYADELPSYGVFVREGNEYVWYNAEFLHHHVPTVEDVLTKMLEQAVGYSDAHTTVALDTIAEYAAKLKLAEKGGE